MTAKMKRLRQETQAKPTSYGLLNEKTVIVHGQLSAVKQYPLLEWINYPSKIPAE